MSILSIGFLNKKTGKIEPLKKADNEKAEHQVCFDLPKPTQEQEAIIDELLNLDNCIIINDK